MRRTPHGLTPDEALLWARVAATVTPLERRRPPPIATPDTARSGGHPPQPPGKMVAKRAPSVPSSAQSVPPSAPPVPRPLDRRTLDASWDRRLGKGALEPEFTLDLHGASLAVAHARLEHGLQLATTQGARVMLLITGRPHAGVDLADHATRRGAIRARVLDWLAAGSSAGRIAAVRPAHPRHGGAGAFYIVLRKGWR